jgi:hypothetical protein
LLSRDGLDLEALLNEADVRPDAAGAVIRYAVNARWTAWIRVVPERGEPVISEVCIASTDPETPAGGLTARDIAAVRLGRAFDEFRRHTRANFVDGVRALEPGGSFYIRGFRSGGQPRRGGPGRRGHPNSYYAEIAARYVAIVAKGSRTPIADLAQELFLTSDYVRDLVATARKRGLLTRPSRRGRAGGELTARALEALRDMT